MNRTSIEWTHRPQTGGVTGGFTWNPIRARHKFKGGSDGNGKTGTFCTRISPGCKNCYASVINKRFGTGAEYTVPNLADHEFYIDEKILAEPLKRKKPATIFVADMFDLFHEAIPDEMIERVFRTMCLNEDHTYQLLTKRAERMQAWVSAFFRGDTPRANIWLGVSVEDQQRADERIELLQRTPAAIRFLSVEPQLEEIWIENHLMGQTSCGRPMWVICGGESGPGARPFNLAWAESLLAQCKTADVPFFMKQFGRKPTLTITETSSSLIRTVHQTLRWKSSKGNDPAEWPAHLRVREFPR
jgi:protein gp37